MNITFKIVKDIPVKQISKFEDRVVYNTALLTREYTKNANAYPYLTGKLRASEVSLPITGSNKEYGLRSGVNYGKVVWNYNNVNWTNPSTQPQWYYSIFRKKATSIVSSAIIRALKEV